MRWRMRAAKQQLSDAKANPSMYRDFGLICKLPGASLAPSSDLVRPISQMREHCDLKYVVAQVRLLLSFSSGDVERRGNRYHRHWQDCTPNRSSVTHGLHLIPKFSIPSGLSRTLQKDFSLHACKIDYSRLSTRFCLTATVK
jgi:hypothetical protein